MQTLPRPRANARLSLLARCFTILLAWGHTFPAAKHLSLFARHPSLDEAWKGFGALLAIAVLALPVRLQRAMVVSLWRRHRVALAGLGWLLAIVHLVPGVDHLPRFVAEPSWSDGWRGLGAVAAAVWFVLPLAQQARVIALVRDASYVLARGRSALTAFVAMLVVVLVGCAAGDSPDQSVPVSDSGRKDTATSGGDDGIDTAAGGDTATGADTATGVDTTVLDTAADAGCGTSPKLHAVGSPPTVYCPFSATTSGGKDIYCASGQQCCETPSSAGTPSTCVASTATCPVSGSTTIECYGPTNCGTGKVCCGTATTIDLKPGCAYDSAVGWKGTKCATSCASSEFTICDAAGACAGSKTCTPFKAVGADYGFCN